MSFTTAFWGWPQWFVAGWLLFVLVLSASLHGQPVKGTRNAFIPFTKVIITIFVLAAGGFFK